MGIVNFFKKFNSQRYGGVVDNSIDKKSSTMPDLDPSFSYSFRQMMSYINSQNVSMTPYADYVWVFACSSFISKNISNMKMLNFYSEKTGKETEIPEIKKLLNRPNGLQTYADFLEDITLKLMLPGNNGGPGGQCFIVAKDKNGNTLSFAKDSIIYSLELLGPDEVEPWIKNDYIVGWKHKTNTLEYNYYEFNQIIRIRLHNPYDKTKGICPYIATKISVEKDSNADKLANALYSKGGFIGGVLETDRNLNPDQVKELKTGWQQAHQGINNAGSVPILHNGLKFNSIDGKVSDMDFSSQKKAAREEIMAAYGVPKIILGLTDDVNRATAYASMSIFWKLTIIPILNKIADALNSQWFCYVKSGDIKCKFDLESVEWLKEDTTIMLDNINKLVDMGHSVNESLTFFNMEKISNNDWANKNLIKGTRVDLNSGEIIGSPYAEPLAENTEDPETDESDSKNNLDTNKAIDIQKKELKIKNSISKLRRSYLWKDYIEHSFDPAEKLFQKFVNDFFETQKSLVNKLVDKWVSSASIKNTDQANDFNSAKLLYIIKKSIDIDVNDFLFVKKIENKKLETAVKSQYRKLVNIQGKQMEKELGKLVKWNERSPEITKFIDKRAKIVLSINSTTFNMLNKKVGNLINEIIARELEGEKFTTNSIAKEIKDEVEEVYNLRIDNSKTISRTEVGAIFSETRQSIFTEEGVPYKEWSSSMDEKVRTSEEGEGFDHEIADGEVVKTEEPFINTGEEIMFPNDANGHPSNTINCRCVALPLYEKPSK